MEFKNPGDMSAPGKEAENPKLNSTLIVGLKGLEPSLFAPRLNVLPISPQPKPRTMAYSSFSALILDKHLRHVTSSTSEEQ